MVHNDKKNRFEHLLDKNKTVSKHTRNLQILLTEMFKVKFGESSFIVYELFQLDKSNNYNFRKNRGFKPGNPKTVSCGTKTIFVFGAKLWIILPGGYKNLTNLKKLKTMIKPFSTMVHFYTP